MLAEFSSLQHCRQSRNAEADVRSDFQEKGLLQKSVESRLSTALFVSEDFKLEKTITR